MKYIKLKFILPVIVAICSIATVLITNADDQTTTKGGEIVIENPTQSKKFHIASIISRNEKEFTSDAINTDFPFNAVSFSWFAPQEVNVQLFARFQKESWSDWQEIGRDIDVEEMEQSHQNTSNLIFTPYTNILQYKLIFENPDQAKDLTNLKIDYIDSTQSAKATYAVADANTDGLNIISRAQWGADESLRFDAANNETWPREYYTPKRFVIHHTDSSDVSNPMATLRAIYYFHAKSHDWGDIGYNYLIDAQGNIYEGRSGGDGVVGAHAYMNNRGSIGIAVLGCFHPGQKNCNTSDNLTPQTKAALDRLIAVKSQIFGINPTGQAETGDHGVMSTILGHRDVGHSNCPGDNIYKQLGVIKNESNVQLASLPALTKYATSASLISGTKQTVQVAEGSTAQLIVKFKNTGQATWRGYEDDYLYVGSDVKKLGLIDGYKFAASSDEGGDSINTSIINGKLLEGNVKPGETGTFVVNLPAENATKTYTLAWKDKGYFSKTDFSISTVKVRGQSAYQAFVPIYKASLITATIPDTLPSGTSQAAQITLLNAGNVPWDQESLILSVPIETGIKSDLLDSITFHPQESDIQPGQIATFNLTFKSPSSPRVLWHIVKLEYAGNELLNYNQKITVAGPYTAEIISNDLPSNLKRGAKSTVTLKIKNIGSKSWAAPTIKSTSDTGAISALADSSWSNLKVIKTINKTVAPGEIATFTFKIKASNKAGDTKQLYKLWDGKQAIILNGQELITYSTAIVK